MSLRWRSKMLKTTSLSSLYDITVAAVCDEFRRFQKDVKYLPESILFDVYFTLYQKSQLDFLAFEFRDLNSFARVLKVTNKRIHLIKCFQALMRHGKGVSRELANLFEDRCEEADSCHENRKEFLIDLGLSLGWFLSDAGWFCESSRVLRACKKLCLTLPQNIQSWQITLECCYKLLHAEVFYAQFDEATMTKELLEKMVSELRMAGVSLCLAGLYTQFSLYSYHMSDYNSAFKYSTLAVKDLANGTGSSPRIVVETLAQASKSSVVKRNYKLAESLIKTAVSLAREAFGSKHPKYADVLLDYGFYLLNSDSMKDSVEIYEKALRLKESIFGTRNLLVAIAHEELAYANYVFEYSSGRFYGARKHAEDAIETMLLLLPRDHLLLASAQRVKALILEEIALDNWSENSEDQTKMLADAEDLHQDALKLAKRSFGEFNVQTAKHYGNLGRLYQSMRKYKEAEEMHLKAISIKESLLGEEDYEVGLSIGHLASLYNYHMQEYKKAEKLYYRSIAISLKLFTETYSGLEYDYRGLINVYERLGDADNVARFNMTIDRWRRLRLEYEARRTSPLLLPSPPSSLTHLAHLITTSHTAKELFQAGEI